MPTIWSYGHRNPQGLAQHPVTGELWDTEHGPRGGDEMNLVRPGRNYGWPVITYGMNYNGTPITALTAKEGMEQPVVHWTPSIAVCGIDFYAGDRFPRWKNNLLVTALGVGGNAAGGDRRRPRSRTRRCSSRASAACATWPAGRTASSTWCSTAPTGWPGSSPRPEGAATRSGVAPGFTARGRS